MADPTPLADTPPTGLPGALERVRNMFSGQTEPVVTDAPKPEPWDGPDGRPLSGEYGAAVAEVDGASDAASTDWDNLGGQAYPMAPPNWPVPVAPLVYDRLVCRTVTLTTGRAAQLVSRNPYRRWLHVRVHTDSIQVAHDQAAASGGWSYRVEDGGPFDQPYNGGLWAYTTAAATVTAYIMELFCDGTPPEAAQERP